MRILKLGLAAAARLVASITPDTATLRDVLRIYFAAQDDALAPATLKIYRNAAKHLTDYFGADCLVIEITPQRAQSWRAHLLKIPRFKTHPNIDESPRRLSLHTVRRLVGSAKTLFRWLHDNGVITENPFAKLQRPHVPPNPPKAVSREDFAKLLNAARTYDGTRRNMADAIAARNVSMLLFLASSGCRVGGMCSASLDTLRIDDSHSEVMVTEKHRGGGKTRAAYLGETATLALLEWLDHRPAADHSKIFVMLDGRNVGAPIHPHAVRQVLNRLGKRAGVERCNPHAFRHAAAREWLQNGADLSVVSQMLGHSDIHVTARHYARWKPSELSDRHRDIDWT